MKEKGKRHYLSGGNSRPWGRPGRGSVKSMGSSRKGFTMRGVPNGAEMARSLYDCIRSYPAKSMMSV